MSDGDNIQWLLNWFITDTRWFGNNKRGQLDKGALGKGSKGLIQTIFNDFNFMESSDFIDTSKISLVHSSGSMDEQYISFMPKNVNKGVALNKYSRLLDIDKSKIFLIINLKNHLWILKKL